MNRRQFLVRSGPVAVSWSLLAAGIVSAQRQEQDLEKRQILVASSLPLSDEVWQQAAIESYRGVQSYFAEVNAAGGIEGHLLSQVVLDNGNDAALALEQLSELMANEEVICLLNFIATPETDSVLTAISAQEEVVLLGPMTGVPLLPMTPHQQIFVVRPSYRHEVESMVRHLLAQGLTKFAVFYQLDAIGRTGFLAATASLAQSNLFVVAEATHPKEQGADAVDYYTIIQHFQQAAVEAVICITNPDVFIGFVMSSRNNAWVVPLVSISDSFSALHQLREVEIVSGLDYTTGVIVASSFPPVQSSIAQSSSKAVSQFREVFDRWQVPAPEPYAESYQAPRDYSAFAFEAFINAQVLAEGLKLAGARTSRRAFKAALESLTDLKLGLGQSLTFAVDDHQGLEYVDFIAEYEGRWAMVRDWNDALGGN